MIREIRHFHLFCGIGGGAAGFNLAHARVGTMEGRFRCLGGVDSDPSAVRDFDRLAGVPGTRLDLFDRDQYVAWHGHKPPEGWREATPEDIRRAAGNERPHIVFTSPPCKGFSGLLSESRSASAKYQALNRLTVRGLFLMFEAWADDPPEFVLMENVPRIATRGAPLLDVIGRMFDHYGYAWADGTHDCGELGGLAQSRKRFLRVARHRVKVPPFLYQPEKKRLRSVGEVLGALPLPGDAAAGPMHSVPRLTWKTWVRLAFVEAGSDWRSLNRLAVEDGVLRDYLIVPDINREGSGNYGVCRWDESCGTISGDARPSKGRYSVADPRRPDDRAAFGQYGVRPWDGVGPAVTGKAAPGSGPFTVADPRHHGPEKFNNIYRIVPWNRQAATVTGAGGKAQCVADPRCDWHPAASRNKYRIVEWNKATGCVIGSRAPCEGAACVADPRPGIDHSDGHYVTGGHYGVVPWDGQSGAVTAHAKHDRGHFSVADPRGAFGGYPPAMVLPEANEQLTCVIRALDGTWHRPFTTLELAALQDLVDPGDFRPLDGASHTAWREHVGNAVPRAAAQAIGGVIGTALLLAWAGQTFTLGMTPIWVRQVAVAAAVDVPLAGGAA
ncbi:DNA cytosine methyltransferase [Shumkonia mesophila]|uniref:DNA cytosine methyltransferase n=1 Tax=Shumkonia mesophila TaxID=2838854 RepID=UPI00293508CA|nr:DNA cytosine methyltransferase [Shumkonia mesophila]